MRKIVILCFALLIILLTSGLKSMQNDRLFYYSFDRKITLIKSSSQLVVKFKKNKRSNIKLISLYSEIKSNPTEWKNDSTLIINVKPENRDALQTKFLNQSDVKVCNPVFKLETGFDMVVTDDILVKFKNNVTKSIKDSLYNKYGVQVYQKSELFDWLKVPEGANALQIANDLQESGLTIFSHPNFYNKIEVHQVVPNDTYFSNQFYLRNVGQVFCDGHSGTYAADNKASLAWSTTTGLNNITVAVLDQGVVSDHPDLPNTRQVRLDSSNFAEDGTRNNPSPTGDMDHGTACAGIIGATQNNNQGISGIAPNCKIMPIRIFNSNGSGISSADIALAIDYARRHGADILSNSWGYGLGATDPNLIPAIVTAIQNATSYGRGGKGCVVVFSASNSADHNQEENGEIRFPANVNISGVLTVGASERYDHQANYSPTGNPSSQENQIIDVVAPSHKAYSSQITGETFEVYSLDIVDTPGYNSVKSTDSYGGMLPTVGSILPNSGTNYLSYTARMGGTSAACPQVAATAALILSINPNLTQQEVFNIITSSADKVGGYTYTNNKSNELGYGRININSAVAQAVTSTNMSVSGSFLVCSTGSDFVVNNLRATDDIIWTCGGYLTMISSQGSNPCRFVNSGGTGYSWV
ncbi:MAG TPA: S8 family serine peptidase, partial [Ignavibacteriaceae bacterium]|nr:S8 family serine peptidase [Ignavibacteriaceae bacterium]